MKNIRKDFPYFQYSKNGIFLDSASTTLKPQVLIDSLTNFYSYEYANIHRGIYSTSSLATTKFENTRKKISEFINSKSEKEIIFTRNATESINIIAHSFGKKILNSGDEILISATEHHANMIPWQELCKKTGSTLKIIPTDEDGRIKLSSLEKLLTHRSKIISINYMSNVIGGVNDVAKIVSLSKNKNIFTVIDACQAIAHLKVDVTKLDCDFLVFSAHKVYGPSGVGILYGKYELLMDMPPLYTGGGMISYVNYKTSKFLPPPHKFEAGTPAIAEVIAFGSVLNYLEEQKWQDYWIHEKLLIKHIRKEINKLTSFKSLGNQDSSIISLIHTRSHPYDIGEILSQQKIFVRSGNHCAQPLMQNLSISGTIRISVGIYNIVEDIEKLICALLIADKML